MSSDGPVTGVLLAAGAGRRAGGPKALRRDPDGRSWLGRTLQVLRDGGCDDIVVVLGAAAAQARELLAEEPAESLDAVTVIENPSWLDGVAGSLRLGLATAAGGSASAALVHLVDLPDVGAAVLRRLLAEVAPTSGALARAGYAGVPGHPVLIGRDHLPSVLDGLAGDRGAQVYLDAAGAVLVECGDLATGADADGPAPAAVTAPPSVADPERS